MTRPTRSTPSTFTSTTSVAGTITSRPARFPTSSAATGASSMLGIIAITVTAEGPVDLVAPAIDAVLRQMDRADQFARKRTTEVGSSLLAEGVSDAQPEIRLRSSDHFRGLDHGVQCPAARQPQRAAAAVEPGARFSARRARQPEADGRTGQTDR